MDYSYTEGGLKTVWTTEATLYLLDLWEESIEELRGARKNTIIYKEIAEEMSCFGPSSSEVKNKIDNLTRRYRRESSKVGQSNWEHYEKIKGILSCSTTLCESVDTTFEASARDDEQPSSSNSRKRKSSVVEKSLEREGKGKLRRESIGEDVTCGNYTSFDFNNCDKKDSTRVAEHSFDQIVKLKEMDEKLQIRLKQMDIDGMLKVKRMELEMRKIELAADERLRKMELELKYNLKHRF